MMAERGVVVSHSTILRWVQRYVPEFERRLSRYARRVHSSWRMGETAVPVRGGGHYLYKAVDKYGKTVDSLLCTDRSDLAARAFFTKALQTHAPRWPKKVNLDGNAASHRALRLLRQENYLLAQGVDPSALKAALGRQAFGVMRREWESEQQ
jgi:transposase-like protein